MTADGVCSFRWTAGRWMTNTDGERFQTMPVEHVCERPRWINHDRHRCPCGAEHDPDPEFP